jgi:hypothetical protein
MKVVVDGPASVVSISDAEDLDGLSVVLLEVSAERASELIGDLGRIEGDHVWLSIQSLLELSPKPRSCSWDARFAKTMADAQKSGWTDPTARFVRAHIEPSNVQS